MERKIENRDKRLPRSDVLMKCAAKNRKKVLVKVFLI